MSRRKLQLIARQAFRDVVLGLIEGGDDHFRNEVSVRLKNCRPSPKPPRKRKRTDDEEQLAQFVEQQLWPNGTKRPKLNNTVRAFKNIKSQLDVSPTRYQCLATEAEADPAGRSSGAVVAMTREQKVMQRHEQMAEGLRRISLLWVAYEVTRLEPEVTRRYYGGRVVEYEVAAAEREFASRARIDVGHIRALRNLSRRYQDIAACTNGLGMILMLGARSTVL